MENETFTPQVRTFLGASGMLLLLYKVPTLHEVWISENGDVAYEFDEVRLLRQGMHPYVEYYRITLSAINGGVWNPARLMLLARTGNQHRGYKIRYKDGNCNNNRFENLVLIPRKDQIAYKVDRKRGVRSRSSIQTQLVEDHKGAILGMVLDGFSSTEIGKIIGCSSRTINRAVKRWTE